MTAIEGLRVDGVQIPKRAGEVGSGSLQHEVIVEEDKGSGVFTFSFTFPWIFPGTEASIPTLSSQLRLLLLLRLLDVLLVLACSNVFFPFQRGL